MLWYSYGGVGDGDGDGDEGVGVDVVVVAFDGVDGGRPQTWDSVVLTKARLGLLGSHIALCAGVNVDDCGAAP